MSGGTAGDSPTGGRVEGGSPADGGQEDNETAGSYPESAAEPVTLREVLDRMAPHPPVKLHCRLLDPGLEEAVCALALDCGMAERLILSGNTDPALCGQSPLIRRIAEVYLDTEYHIPSFYRGFREIPDFDAQAARRMLDLCSRAGSQMVHIRQNMVTRRFLERLKDRGVGVSAWPVDDPEDLRWFLAAGAADISTRNLAPALALRG